MLITNCALVVFNKIYERGVSRKEWRIPYQGIHSNFCRKVFKTTSSWVDTHVIFLNLKKKNKKPTKKTPKLTSPQSLKWRNFVEILEMLLYIVLIMLMFLGVVELVSVCKPLSSVIMGLPSCFGRSYLVQMNKLYHASKKHKVLHIYMQKIISIHLFSQTIKIIQKVHMHMLVTNQTIWKSRNCQDWEEHTILLIILVINISFFLRKTKLVYIINLQNFIALCCT